jgi:prolyl-tRNA editing enzyme YbaK/EbsC (Cys-tRNA(Pro) deacylase)
MDFATAATNMEYGGIGPIGKPEGWRYLIDSRVLDHDYVIIGSGIRGSKIAVSPKVLSKISGAEVCTGLAIEV